MARPGLIRETIGDAIGALCVFAIPAAFAFLAFGFGY